MGRFWSVTAVAAPIVVSIAALIVAGLSFQDQHSADVAAAIASEEADADLVSFWGAGLERSGCPEPRARSRL